MSSGLPAIVVFTRHAERRAVERRLSPYDLAELLLAHHDQRRRNVGDADWLVRSGGVVIVYDWPDGEDDATALVISVWRE
jgi:hypothetical protein